MSNVAIWKFTLDPSGIVTMPTHARVLSTAFQGDDLQIWAVVVRSNLQQQRRFAIIPTGVPTDDARGDFVGTAFHPSGLVFHVFDRGHVAALTPEQTNGG